MTSTLERNIASHFDVLAEEAPTIGGDIVTSARRRGERIRNRRAVAVGGSALTVAALAGVTSTLPRSDNPTDVVATRPTPQATGPTTPGDAQSTSDAGFPVISEYKTLQQLFDSATVTVHGTVTDVELVQADSNAWGNVPHIILHIEPIATTDAAVIGDGEDIQVVWGPVIEGSGHSDLEQALHGPDKLLGLEAVWPLNRYDDVPQWFGLVTWAAQIDRDGDRAIPHRPNRNPITTAVKQLTWDELLAVAGLDS